MIKKLWDIIRMFFYKLKCEIFSINKKDLALYAIAEIAYLLWLGICYAGGVLIGRHIVKLVAGKPEEK